ncbi:NADP-dependent alcohol dehydrogenase [Hoeflea marina]|uniref:NADP-dependent alcohol dehydrogenase n=2 Tax=Hoeflea marina TaxID=274592 RepID=A0A317PFH7_9HYPH|nr:iron-containing alcohol dehydrogenase [Hoeflea marina]PWV98815.1 NADP-dependent alcohol dehydrogenase [Hoeflea marina]PWV98826.1 NADP-dependent alcohol dehydrogenase [Hoeflea marina]
MTMTFTLETPTRILFGEGMIDELASQIGPEERVLLLYGGGSIMRNGVHDRIRQALAGHVVTEFGGIEPNPEYETVMRAAVLAREEKVTFILGVGGGSVIDAAKFLSCAAPIGGGDAWDRMLGGRDLPEPLPSGAILTLPATGSESNPVSVISRTARGLKLPFKREAARPRFAILDPSTMKSLPRRQLENGVVDAVTHVLEQYLTLPVNAPVQHGYSEALLAVLFEWGPRLLVEDSDEARENVMWAANQALNGLIGAGVPQDWSTHMIGHALTALHGLDHARSLSLVMPHLMRNRMPNKVAMLARYGRRVWGVAEADDRAAADLAIARTEDFFRRMNCPVAVRDVPGLAVSPDKVVQHLEEAGQLPLGENADIGAAEVRAILKAAGAAA